ncbi:MAG: adenylyltransferase/cytidyltransferase family protein [Chloroflexi bacterium]|nr:adenylyltransferase/cytidyltransferase family protein [Chloroflexota bacterium]OJV91272.1 MAG: ADP-heptose synthase [Chloroflexi bacterium 54-19]
MILSREELARQAGVWKAAGKRVVFTNGCFDLIHLGHVRYLEEARALGDVLVLGLNSDSSVRQLKGPQRPLVNEQERAALMSALRPVDHVVIFEELTADNILLELKPAIYVKGGDYSLSDAADTATHKPKPLPEEPTVRSYGGQVVLIPFLPGHSTTDLIRHILQVFKQ